MAQMWTEYQADLQSRATCGSVVLLQPWSLLSTIHIATRGHMEARTGGGERWRGCIIHHMGPGWDLKTTLAMGLYWSEWPALPPSAIMMSRPKLQSRAMSESVTLLLIFLGPIKHWRLYKCPGSGTPQQTMSVSGNHATTESLPIWVDWVATHGQGDLQTQSAAEGHVGSMSNNS